jgi:hypothetical protein
VSERSSTSIHKTEIAVVAPMPRASVSIAVRVKPGIFAKLAQGIAKCVKRSSERDIKASFLPFSDAS